MSENSTDEDSQTPIFDTLSKEYQSILTSMVFTGLNQTKAYMRAYPDSSKDSARSSVCDILAIPSVKDALEELKQEVKEKASVDAQWALSKLVDLVDIGMYKPSPDQLAAMTEDEQLALAKVGTDINAVKGVINEINKMIGGHVAEKIDHTSGGKAIKNDWHIHPVTTNKDGS